MIDNVSRPTFIEDKLSTYLRVEGRRTSGISFCWIAVLFLEAPQSPSFQNGFA